MNTYLVPEKRFSGFNEYWEMKPLGNLITVKSGLGFKAYEYTNDGVRLLQIENVSYGETKWIEPTYLPESYLVKYPDLVLKEGDIVLALNRPVTNGVLKIVKLNKKDSPSILYQRVGKLDFISDNISADYMYQVFTVYVKKFVIRESIGSDQPFISLKSLYKYKVPVTSKEEQQKIADFLSSVDKKIRLLKQKHSLLQQYKKGVMQQLFSQQIRFKDDNGKDFSDWQEKTLADLADKMSNKNKDDTIKKVLTNSAKHGIVNQRDYFDKDIANENNLTNYSIVDKDDFVYNPRISESAPVGPIKRNHIGQGIMSPLYTVFRRGF